MAYYKKPYPKAPVDPNAPKKKGNPNWKPGYKKSTIVPGSMYKPLLNPSNEQKDIIDAVVDGSDSLIIEAFAGCGKTSTIVETMHRVHKKNSSLSQAYFVFAKRNSTEAIGKCNAESTVKTAHAFGLQTLAKAYGKINVDKDKTERIATAIVGPDEKDDELRFMLCDAIDLGKDYLAETVDDIIAITDKHDISTCGLSNEEFADKVLKAMEFSAQQTNVASFSDMTWLPIKKGLNIPTFDLVYPDECQDLNRARQELIFRSLGNRGRLVAVGDKFQAIFGFSGADRHSLPRIKERTNATELPLHRTFRCGRAIVKLAQQFVPSYEAAETNPDGEVLDIDIQSMMSDNGAAPGDFILSRTNAPITKIAMKLLVAGRRCTILGKNIGAGMIFMIKNSKAKTVAEFQSWLEDWKNAEIDRLIAKRKDYEHVVDKAKCLENFCVGERDLFAVKAKINAMFDDESDATRITLSSIHKAKGLEAKRVFLLEDSFTCRPKTEEDREQERNIRYVAITRAIDSLYLTSGMNSFEE